MQKDRDVGQAVAVRFAFCDPVIAREVRFLNFGLSLAVVWKPYAVRGRKRSISEVDVRNLGCP